MPDLFSGRAVLFVGAGFSNALTGAPGWGDLIQELWRESGEERALWESSLPDDAFAEMEILDLLFRRKWLHDRAGKAPPYDGHPLKVAIHNYFQRQKIEIEDWGLFEGLLDLGFCDWVTTNWDTAIEEGLKTAERVPTIVRRGALLEDLARMKRAGNELPSRKYPSVLKFHGCLSQPRHMVVTTSDLNEFLDGDLYLKSLLVTKLMQRSVIYLGYRLGDENLIRIVGDVRAEMTRLAAGRPVPSTQVILVRNRAKYPQHLARLEELGVQVLECPGVDDFVAAVKDVQSNPRRSRRGDELALALLQDQHGHAESMAKLSKFGLGFSSMIGRDPAAFFGMGKGVMAVPSWFRSEIYSQHSGYNVHDWVGALEILVEGLGDTSKLAKFVMIPSDSAFQDFYRGVEKLVVGIALHVAKLHRLQYGPDWRPLARVVASLCSEEARSDRDAAKIFLAIADAAPSFSSDEFVARAKSAAEVVARRGPMYELEALISGFVRLGALDALAKGLENRSNPERAAAVLMPLGRMLGGLRAEDERVYERVLTVAKRWVAAIGVAQCRVFLSTGKDAVKWGLDSSFVEWVFADEAGAESPS